MSSTPVPIDKQPWRIALTILVFAGLFAVVVGKLVELQHFSPYGDGDDLAAIGEAQRTRRISLPAPRGNIYDSGGMPLVVTRSVWSVFCDADYMDDRLRATVTLSELLPISRDELRDYFESGRNGQRMLSGLDETMAQRVRELDLAGIYVRREYARDHVRGATAAHTLGFTDVDQQGAAGVELRFDEVLAGVPGHETWFKDARGQLILAEHLPRQAPQPGAHVQLTIDASVQAELEAALLEAVQEHQAANAAGIVLRPSTGEIIAMASLPTFDPMDRSDLQTEHLRDNVLAYVYEPGSTMKPLIAAAAVIEGLARWDEQIFCEDGVWTHRVGRARRTIHDHSHRRGGHQWLTVVEGIAKSDNILMAKLGLRLGPERLFAWTDRYQFGRKTGIVLSGEDAGLRRPLSTWNELGACMSVPMGHEIAVTPLQMALAHAAIANGGVWRPARLVKRIWRRDGSGERDLPLPEAGVLPRRIMAPDDAVQVQRAMLATMEEGTGAKLALDGYSSGGKTGTTTKLIDGRYSDDRIIGSFICYAPLQPGIDPELLCLVVVDDPQGDHLYGSNTAGPVVRRVLQFGLEHYEVPEDRPRGAADAP